MTREKLLRYGKEYLCDLENACCKIGELHLNFVRESIKALEREQCEDAVSRQAVLDKKELVQLEDGQSFYCISPEDVETLPSVTPKPKYNTSEWCHDCSEYDHDKHCCPRFNRVIRNTVEEIKQPKTGHWIETAEEYYKAVNEYGGGVNENTPYFVDDIACSECLAKYSVIDNETERFDHCPSCGAKMIEPKESEDKE